MHFIEYQRIQVLPYINTFHHNGIRLDVGSDGSDGNIVDCCCRFACLNGLHYHSQIIVYHIVNNGIIIVITNMHMLLVQHRMAMRQLHLLC